MTLATLANIVVEYTPFFEYLGVPFVPLLSLLQVPEASEAAQTVVVGFADMLLPALIGSGIIESEFTKFVIASLSVTQLIYLSEVGALLLGSKLPVNFLDFGHHLSGTDRYYVAGDRIHGAFTALSTIQLGSCPCRSDDRVIRYGRSPTADNVRPDLDPHDMW